jgi:endonuclease-3 related protein
MPALDASFPAMVAALAAHYGPTAPRGAAEGLDPFPAMVAVLLARASDPRKATRALDALAGAGLLDPRALAEADVAEIDDTLKSAGVAVSARGLAPIRRLSRWIVERPPGAADADGLDDVATESLREELAQLNGIGPATADALLLLALRRPSYPLDRATYRILLRHGWIDPAADYDEARAVIGHPGPDDPDTLAQLSDWLARIGHDFCRARAAKCERCPLRPFLPDGGPIEPEVFPE